MSQADFVSRGQALVSSGQFQEAVKVCRLGLLGRPTTVEGRIVLGQALLALKRYDEVLAEMRVALELDHASGPAHALRGEALLRKGDAHGAHDALQKARAADARDPRIGQLLAEAAAATNKPKPVRDADPFGGESLTKNYPNSARDGGGDDDDEEEADVVDSGGSYTRPTSLSAPGAKKRTPPPARAQIMPPRATLAVGDRSGTMEVDPEADGVEIDEDFGDVVAPPSAPAAVSSHVPSSARSPQPRRVDGGRGEVIPSSGARHVTRRREQKPVRAFGEISSVELADDELMDLETLAPFEPSSEAKTSGQRKPVAAVRNAINQPSGPLAAYPAPAVQATLLDAPPPQLGAYARPAAPLNPPPAMGLPPPQPLPPAPQPRGPLAAALPTQAAMPMPMPMPLAPSAPPLAKTQLAMPMPAVPMQPTALPMPNGLYPLAPGVAAVRPTVAIPMPGGGDPAWAQPAPGPPMPRIGPDEATRQPMPIDAQILALSNEASSPSSVAAAYVEAPSFTERPRSQVRKGRSRLQITVWLLVGIAMIGGGVFAGFQIRAMRLGKQIEAARDEAVELATTDTWKGWIGARNRLASIAQASATLDNRAVLARTRALVAFEFGDGLAEATAAVAELDGQGGLDGELAAAFLALAKDEVKAAQAAADRALAIDGDDPAALYARSQAALYAGDLAAAIAHGKRAAAAARAMYCVGLARVYAAAGAWNEATAALDAALKTSPNHPGALIVRGVVNAESSRLATGGPELRAQLAKIAKEGAQPVGEQDRGVSPAQVAYANLALARVDVALGKDDASAALQGALAVKVDDQRFADEIVETLYAIRAPQLAKAIGRTLGPWPRSQRTRLVQVRLALVEGRTSDALAALDQAKDLAALPLGLALRGAARTAAGELDGARSDFDAALKKVPQLELAIAGRAWLELRADQLADAKAHIEPLAKPGAGAAITAAYAAVLRASGDLASRTKARELLDAAVRGGLGTDGWRVRLEYARTLRDLGEPAKGHFQEAARGGDPVARLEFAFALIEDRQPKLGAETIDRLLEDAGAAALPALLLEAARARTLAGDSDGAQKLLARAEKLPGVVAWQLERERGRVLIRREDWSGSAAALSKALDGCGSDIETFLVAGDAVTSDPTQTKLAAKIRASRGRLKSRPEVHIVDGKLALAENQFEAAEQAYSTAVTELENEKASKRRKAQATLGKAVVLYYGGKDNDMTVKDHLALTIQLDPTLFTAYLYLADLLGKKDPPKAFEHVQEAIRLNPDSSEGWILYGTLAFQLRKSSEYQRALRQVQRLLPNGEELRQLQGLR